MEDTKYRAMDRNRNSPKRTGARPLRGKDSQRDNKGTVDRDKSLRTHLRKLLDWQDAHVNFDAATDGIPADLRGIAPQGLPYSPWQLIEHL
ncbi:MAG TPA: hypothetical protein VGQ81_02475 [Acidobacteriota bacterium]|nr:hypothetical protein [Acidobacteriota bacterium]